MLRSLGFVSSNIKILSLFLLGSRLLLIIRTCKSIIQKVFAPPWSQRFSMSCLQFFNHFFRLSFTVLPSTIGVRLSRFLWFGSLFQMLHSSYSALPLSPISSWPALKDFHSPLLPFSLLIPPPVTKMLQFTVFLSWLSSRASFAVFSPQSTFPPSFLERGFLAVRSLLPQSHFFTAYP